MSNDLFRRSAEPESARKLSGILVDDVAQGGRIRQSLRRPVARQRGAERSPLVWRSLPLDFLFRQLEQVHDQLVQRHFSRMVDFSLLPVFQPPLDTHLLHSGYQRLVQHHFLRRPVWFSLDFVQLVILK